MYHVPQNSAIGRIEKQFASWIFSVDAPGEEEYIYIQRSMVRRDNRSRGVGTMKYFEIKSRIYGLVEFTLRGKYVHARMAGREFSQVCEGGGFRGNTVTSAEGAFEADCRRWWTQFMKRNRAEDHPMI